MPTLTLSVTLLARALIVVSAMAGSAWAQTVTAPAQLPRPAAEPVPRIHERRLTWSVAERVRYAALFNQFRPGLSGDDRALVFRTTLQAELAWRHVTIGGAVQDARAYLTGPRTNISTALVNPVDLLQAYVRFGSVTPSRSRTPEIQIGRFSMELGSGRLVAQEAYRDVTRVFTGAKARWRPHAAGMVTAFGVFPVATLPDDRAGLLDNRIVWDKELFNQRFWGTLYESERLWRGTRGEAYLYSLREHDVPGRRETRNRKVWTAGLRVFRLPSPGVWDFDVESAWQGGSAHATTAPTDARALDVSARLLHAHAGWTFARPWSPRVNVEYDYGSGDADPLDGEWNRLDGLFGHRRVELGPTSIYGALGRENIETLGVRLSLAPTARIDAFAAYRVLWLAAAADSFASTGVRDPAGRSGHEAGRHVDLRARAWVVPGVIRLEAGVSRLFAGPFLRAAPNATRAGDTTFFYGDVTYTIGSRERAPAGPRRP